MKNIMNVDLIVVCYDSNGCPDVTKFCIELSKPYEYDNTIEHMDAAEEYLDENGYNHPYVFIDEYDRAYKYFAINDYTDSLSCNLT